ncbi:MAG: hypothetical protein MI810_08020 [Flavobacteriales bacterium]|nr:hypothetical protein [Flavobacteriales bacterium]
MDKFKNRIKYYLFGLGIGLIFTYFLFGSRGCSWLPENRVKNMIAEKEIWIGDSIRDLMQCQNVTNSDIYRLLDDDGDVDFSLSKTSGEPKEYHLSGIKEEKELTIRYALYDSTAEVIDFSYLKDSDCKTTVSNNNKRVVTLPLEQVIEIIEQREFRILDKAVCQMECLELTEEEVLNFHSGEKVYVEASKPRLKPNPEYLLTGFIGDKEYSIFYIIGENRTRIGAITLKQNKEKCQCSEYDLPSPY